MRQLLRSVEGVAIAFGGLVGFAVLCSNVWWVKQFLATHIKIAEFIHSGWSVPVLLLCSVVVFLIQKQLQRPSLRVKMVSAQWIPRVWDIPLGDLFGAPQQGNQTIDCDFMVELQVVNETDVPVTIGDFEALAIINNQKVVLEYVAQMEDLKLREDDDCVAVPALMDDVKGISLNKGIRYRGWVRFQGKQLTLKHDKSHRVQVWVLDTLDGKHVAVNDKTKPLNQETRIIPVIRR